MSPVFLALTITIVLIICLLFFFVWLVRRSKRFGSKEMLIVLLILLLISAIPVFGHTQINRELQLDHLLNTFDPNQAFAPNSDQKAIEELSSIPKPIHYEFIRDEKVANEESADSFYNEYIEIEGQVYVVTLACYKYPLSWTPFESWVINAVTKE